MASATDPFQPNLRVWSAVVWWLAAGTLVTEAVATPLPTGPLLWAAGAAGILAIGHSRSWWDTLRRQLAFTEARGQTISVKDLIGKVRAAPKEVFMGYGFVWGSTQTQQAYDLRKAQSPKASLLLRLLAKGFGWKEIAHDYVGAAWIHALGQEEPISVARTAFEGNTAVFGVPGCGKTTLLKLWARQSIHRGEAVYIVDPKGSHVLAQEVEEECHRAGRPDDFVYFHLACPERSARIDLMRNWNTQTELASRVSALQATESGLDAWTAFGWMTINTIVDGLLLVDRRPTLKGINRYAEGGPDSLVEKVLERYFSEHIPRWAQRVQPYIDKASKGKIRGPAGSASTPRLVGMVHFYKAEIAKEKPHEAIVSLIGLYEHNREHYGKMVSSLLPILKMLTAGELGDLLSPKADDPNDTRPIYDNAKLIKLKKVVYVGLDTLSNATVGRAVGALFATDLTAVAGSLYNFGVDDEKLIIDVHFDEAAEVVCDPFVQFLNKSREAGFRITTYAQTYSDYASRLGDRNKASMLLGDHTNFIFLRTTDEQTQKVLTEKFGETTIETSSVQYRTTGASQKQITEFTTMKSKGSQDKDIALFPAELLSKLPNLHYVTMMPGLYGGNAVKGRIPFIDNSID